MPPGKSYSFVKFENEQTASNVYNNIHGKNNDFHNGILYLAFAKSIPELENETESLDPPPGLRLILDFVTPDEESKILDTLNWNNDEYSGHLKHRKVQHFGYEFCYDTNRVDVDKPIAPIPEELNFISGVFIKKHCGDLVYDQLTINHYEPGQGIPPHIDTHSVFEDPILSLSLGATYVMDFRKDNKKVSLALPARSLLIMSGESRYAWTHGISPRHNDVINDDDDGLTTKERGTRISLTFRKVRRGNCQCNYPQYCDSKNYVNEEIDNSVAPGLENSYVHKVYDEIAEHFSETRHQKWPNVASFLENIQPGGIVLDVGCGNGKYLIEKPEIFMIGCDRSSGLLDICKKRSREVLLSNCLQLLFKSNSLDAAICIAVIHHLSTPDRRRNAFIEILRVLRPGGKCLIYVWAKEQRRDSKDSTYLRFNSKKTNDNHSTDVKKIFDNLTLNIHENRTNFRHSDVLVPWKRKGGGEYLRYYHVFEESEFIKLCQNLPNSKVEKIFYDQGNWCTILEKI
ncbi:alkylated DNA repair protein alkB homolog 8-like isoform X2 [Aphidius gifuensis]|nr:alkylated DNA repair protein alkB homolog 8-like isoform X2 [Aphidius gifuensis]